MLTEQDDFFSHQMISTHDHVMLNDPTWAERAFFTVSQPGQFLLEMGMSMYPNNNVIEGYAAAVVGKTQYNFRSSRELRQDRWNKKVGPFHYNAVKPLKEWELHLAENKSGVSFDVRFEARSAPYECRSPYIRRQGRLMYDNINFFQPGRYFGTATVAGRTFQLDGLFGHRDRTWGVRNSGEGSIQRGLLTWISAEFSDHSIMAIIYERHNGKLAESAGAVSYEGGRIIPLVGFEHDLKFDPDTRQFISGEYWFTDDNGKVWHLTAKRLATLYLSGVGYRSSEGKRGTYQGEYWESAEIWDLSSPRKIPEFDGLMDNLVLFRCEGREAHGIVETLLGEHYRYWPPRK